MYTEIEAKLKVDSLTEVENMLKRLGAEFVAEQSQEDVLFDDSKKNMAKNDSCLRLRKQVVSGQEKYIVTFKGAKQKSSVKKRREIEIEVSNIDSAKEIFHALGYEEILTVQKQRSLWRLGNCEIALDNLQLLGNFVEIEGPDEKEISEVQKSIGLEKLQHIPKSYAAMIEDKLRHEGK